MVKNFIDVNELKDRAAYRWEKILSTLAPELNPALARIGKHVPCPMHGGKDGFRFFNDSVFIGASVCNTCGYFFDGIVLLGQLKGWDFKTTLNEINSIINIPIKKSDTVADRKKRSINGYFKKNVTDKALIKENEKQQKMEVIWAQSLSLTAQKAFLGRYYLEKRGVFLDDLSILDNTLRFHLSVPYFDKNGAFYQYLPCLLGAVTNCHQRVTLLRIYLDHHGNKAPVDPVKKMMPFSRFLRLDKSSIKLIPLDATQKLLCVAEGIETALSVHCATRLPVWSCINANQMAYFNPPKQIKKLLIWADLDQSNTGQNVASKLKLRMLECGIETTILLPPYELLNQQKSVDWNDVLKKEGEEVVLNLLNRSR